MRETVKKIRRFVRGLRPAQLIVLVFLGIISAGTILLMLPFATVSGESCGLLTALFTATSATCVTGLIVQTTALYWSAFGKVVILCLIQIGGLGFMTIISVFFFALHQRLGLKQRMVIAQSLSIDDFDAVAELVRRTLIGTAILEGVGAILLTIRFCFETSFPQALVWGVFHSISAFCNAGFDILSSNSMADYVGDPLVNFVLIALIMIGGLGFFVWDDVYRNRSFRKLTVHSKLVLICSAALLVLGAGLFAILEWNNPATIGELPAAEKLLASLFQSATLRTAGFESVPQGAMTESSQAFSLILMFIGGSSGSTAGGAKTVTVLILALAVLSGLRGKQHVTVFRRTISDRQVRDALTLVMMMLALAFCGALFLSSTHEIGFLQCLYETVSALATVGTTTGITASLSAAGKVMLICYMFFGRVGIMTIGLGFLLGNRAESRYRYADTRILLG